MHKVILIGGAPTVGKSHLAKVLASELNIPWISTDTIRDQMRRLVSKKDFPSLFLHSEATPELALAFLANNSAQQIVDIQNRESEDVWKGVNALIQTDYVWDEVIIEGIAILPHLVSTLKSSTVDIKPLFLSDNDEERIKRTIYTRGLWDDADKYPDSVKDKEVKWVLAFNNWLKRECKKYHYPMIEIGERTSYTTKVRELID